MSDPVQYSCDRGIYDKENYSESLGSYLSRWIEKDYIIGVYPLEGRAYIQNYL
jgi:hypothetical protein